MPKPVTDAMKTWKPSATAAFVSHLGEGLTKGHDAAFDKVVQWAGGMSSTGGAGAGPDLSGIEDPKIRAAMQNSPLFQNSGKSSVPRDQRLGLAKQMMSAIDRRLGIDPKNDLAALDALNAVPGAPPAPSAPSTTPAGASTAAPPPTATVAKPAAATPTAAGKPAAKAGEASAPIGRASLPDGPYTFADGRKVKVKDGKVFPAE